MIGTFPRSIIGTMLPAIREHCRRTRQELWVSTTFPASERYVVADLRQSSCSPRIGTTLYRIDKRGELHETPALRTLAASDTIVGLMSEEAGR